jgi:Fe-S-cluster-containing dehydrogenase component
MIDKSKQIGCGYCINEKICPIRTPDINRAKLGCSGFLHNTFEMSESYNIKNFEIK